MNRRKLLEQGDTIVELLIALALTSLVLAAVYTTANRSLTGSRRSQERIAAIKLAESQAEALRVYASTVGFTVGGTTTNLCIDILNPLANKKVVEIPVAPNLSPTADTLGSPNPYPAACISTSTGLKYYQWISRTTVTDHNFTIRVRWQRAGGGGNDEVVLKYSVY